MKSLANIGILLTNLGSPDSVKASDVKRYLKEFLMDERVIDIPYLLRTILVKGIIAPFRAPKSAAKYKTIWTAQGSPLIHSSRLIQKALANELAMPIELCMRYANPTPKAALERLAEKNPNLEEVILVPLYPHYAMSSYETAVEHVKQVHLQNNYSFQLRIVPPFYNDPAYIQSLTASIKPFLDKPFDHLLFSYHGIPKRHVLKTDCTKAHCFNANDCCNVPSRAHDTCYRHQIKATTDLTAKGLHLTKNQYSFSFQSRLGADEWLTPYSVTQFASFPKKGIKKLLVACPAFISDCLETLEEIAVEGAELFKENGGEEFTLIPCLNDQPEWITALKGLIDKQLKEVAQD